MLPGQPGTVLDVAPDVALDEARDEKQQDIEQDSQGKQAKTDYTFANQIRRTVLNSPVNFLFLFVPAGFIVNYTHCYPQIIFSINLIAIAPSSIMLGTALDDINIRVGNLISAILDMTFRYFLDPSFP